MKKIPLLIVLAAAVSGFAAAQNATAVYVEGNTDLKDLSGAFSELEIGDPVESGETVITKTAGRADLELANGSTVTVRSGTVFTLGEVELGGEKQSVFSTSVGSVAFRLNKFSGRGPMIRTNNIVAGVRGTEFTVYAGMDGSSLLVVEEGAVELEAQGRAVNLAANEAVEVRPGGAPGEKFTWRGRELDFRTWNEGKVEDFLKDPIEGIRRVETQLGVFRDEMKKLIPVLDDLNGEANIKLEEFRRLRDSKESEKAEELRLYLTRDLGERRRILFLNIRYYALSYLSMRRFVLGGMYAEMKSRFFNDGRDASFQGFLRIYEAVIKDYEDSVVPRLVDADI